jgi:4-amino-4-deoxy-L-arabinose transferase-like glycosyltransferase
MKKAWLLLFLILVLQLVLRLPFLGEPLNQDEATYLQIARRMAQGELLYRDIVDVKPPGIFCVAQALGRNVRLIRVETAVYSLFLTVLLFLIGRRAGGNWLGLVAAFLFALFSGGVFVEGTMVTSELFMLLPLLLALSLFMSGPGGLFAAGLFSGLAVLVKQPAAFNLLGLGLLIVALGWRNKQAITTIGARLLIFFAGSLVFPLLTLLYFWLRGGLGAFINANFFYSLGMAKPSLANFLVKTLLLMLFENSVVWVAALAGGWLIWRCFRTDKLLVILVWTLSSLLGVYAAGFALGHYYLQIIPGLCLLSGLVAVKWRELDWTAATRFIFVSLLVVMSALIVLSEYEFYLAYGPDRISAERYGNNGNSVARDIGLKIRARTRPGDRVYGIASTVFYSDRDSLTKYYLTIRGGRTAINFLGRPVYTHDFGITRSPALVKLVDNDVYRVLADKRTKYFTIYVKDYYAPDEIWHWLKQLGYRFDRELSDQPSAIMVFRRGVK